MGCVVLVFFVFAAGAGFREMGWSNGLGEVVGAFAGVLFLWILKLSGIDKELE